MHGGKLTETRISAPPVQMSWIYLLYFWFCRWYWSC